MVILNSKTPKMQNLHLVLPKLKTLPRASYFLWRRNIQSDMEEGKKADVFVNVFLRIRM